MTVFNLIFLNFIFAARINGVPRAIAVPCYDTDTTLAPAPETTNSTVQTDEYLTVSVTNLYGTQLILSFGSDAGGPPPVGNPSITTILNSSQTQFAFPTGWAGSIGVGPNSNANASKIEGSFVVPPNCSETDCPAKVDVDVSLVNGYSVPITCSSGGQVLTGCNIDLFGQVDMTCPNLVEGPICLNPAREINGGTGPPSPFFAACAGAAYTYPDDNAANVGALDNSPVSCCIGTSCEAPARQGHGAT